MVIFLTISVSFVFIIRKKETYLYSKVVKQEMNNFRIRKTVRVNTVTNMLMDKYEKNLICNKM